MERSSRRRFIRDLAPLGLAALAGGKALPKTLPGRIVGDDKSSDEDICRLKFSLAGSEVLHERSIGEVIIAVGVSFLGTAYAARTLELPGDEHLVVNLRGLDCVTFVENTLALSRCVKLGQNSFDDFKTQLQIIRYRAGIISGYASRLHYFSDWIDDNAKKKVVRNISQELGGIPLDKNFSFMSSHPSSYKQLSDTVQLKRIREAESAINSRQHFYIPKQQLAKVASEIEAGDIIGITTSTEGLDIVHTGIAISTNGILKYLHAPLSRGKVQITDLSLVDYLRSHEKQTGIMVARPLEPST
jgi:hypothetical protein